MTMMMIIIITMVIMMIKITMMNLKVKTGLRPHRDENYNVTIKDGTMNLKQNHHF